MGLGGLVGWRICGLGSGGLRYYSTRGARKAVSWFGLGVGGSLRLVGGVPPGGEGGVVALLDWLGGSVHGNGDIHIVNESSSSCYHYCYYF